MSSANSDLKSHAKVIIVGAGPVGMLTALRLGQANIDTLVIEGHETLLNTTRAIVYMPTVIPVLRELGILDTILQHAYFNTEGVSWRDIHGEQLANLPLSTSNPDDKHSGGVLLVGQWRMNALVLEELKKYPSVQVRFGLKLTSLTDDPSSDTVHLTAQNPKDESTPINLSASFVLGTDGANSATRRLLNLPFDGFTYTSMRIIGIDVVHDFITHESFAPLNFVVHPNDWAVIAYTAQDEHGNSHNRAADHDNAQWRVAYGEDPSLPDDKESIWSRAEAQMSKYIRPDTPFKILRAEPYTIHQRCASQPILGRVALAGDALHSNNPIGGLGLTGGILDAFCYGNAFIRVIRGDEPVALLTQCADARIAAWRDTTDKLSQANLRRLLGEDEETVKARQAMFGKLNGEERDQVAGAIRKGMDGMMVDDFLEGTRKYIAVEA